ncbi:U6 snRNA phosphodiesterase Usb1 [Mucidula mucida]|nr:U6 snRNA phosphodiesterase Usb1 [Mucidula mucida]
MSKRGASLVEYSSSDSDDDSDSRPKRRKLPTLSSSLIVPVPVDNPALHQGRVRTTPHVDGQWASHVYVALKLSRRSSLYTLLSEVIDTARCDVPTLHGFWVAEKEAELHVSLSRPIFLRAHQREDLKCAVKGLANKTAPFTISFAALAALTNDEQTRTFLAVEVGAGHGELVRLSDGLKPLLRRLRQKEYYDAPRYHGSIAWALDAVHLATKSLNERYQAALAAKANAFEAERVEVKIGKNVFAWRFKGAS